MTSAPNPLSDSASVELRLDALGLRLGRRLQQDSPPLEPDVMERLRVARLQALAAHRAVTRQESSTQPVAATAGHGGLDDFDAAPRWSERMGVALVALAIALALWGLALTQAHLRADEMATLDAALLLDDLPPAAYTDPGFMVFLRRATASPP